MTIGEPIRVDHMLVRGEKVKAFGHDWWIERLPSGVYLGQCPCMGIVLEGRSRSELFEAASEALRLIAQSNTGVEHGD